MSKQPEALTQARLHELFDYKDGQLLNKTKRRSQVEIGAPAGHKTVRGYVNIRVDGKMYKAHRLIYLYHHGVMPDMVDHIDCDRANNRIENLRRLHHIDCDRANNRIENLRRLHQSEREGWRYANELEQERKRLTALNVQLLEALERIDGIRNLQDAQVLARATIVAAKGEA